MKNYLILLLCIVTTTAVKAQWSTGSTTNHAVETTTSCSFLSKRRITTDAAGNVFITWFDKRVNDRYKVFVQKFNNNGVPQWTANGVGVSATTTDQVYSEIVPDENGGAIVSWTESRSTTGFDIYAQKLSASGAAQWGTNGIAVCVTSDEQNFSKILADGAGGAFICWYDLRNAGGNSSKEIFIQKINSAGTAALAANGVKVPNAKPDAFNWLNEPPIGLLKSGSDAVVTWEHRGTSGEINMYAQKVSSAGAALWGADGVAITNTSNTNEQSYSVADNAGNTFIAWKNYSLDSLYIQKLNSSGVIQWAAGGVKLSPNFSAYAYTPKVVPDQNGGAIVIWNDNRGSGFDIYMQKLNASGTPQLNEDGVVVCNAVRDQNSSEIVSDGAGGAIVTWDDQRVNADSSDVYAQRISQTGTLMWTANGVAVSNAKHRQRYSSVAPYGSNGAVISWFDNRNEANAGVFCNDVYIQAVKSDGSLGNPNITSAVSNLNGSLANIKIYPNPVIHDLIVENLQSSPLSFRLYDITGKALVSGSFLQHTSRLNMKNYKPGVYILHITGKKGETQTVRLIKQ
jgi:hypothetical protein